MLSIPWSLFTNIEEEGQQRKRSRFNPNKPRPSMDVIGLQILIQLSQAASTGKSNLVVKPNLKLKKKPNMRTNRIDPASYYESSTFLKSCSLCNKDLSLDKDVYMYRKSCT